MNAERQGRRAPLCLAALTLCCLVTAAAFLMTFFSLASGAYSAWVLSLLGVIAATQAVALVAACLCPRRSTLALLGVSLTLAAAAFVVNLHRVP